MVLRAAALLGQILGRGLGQRGDELLGAGRRGHGVFEDDGGATDFFAVEILVGAIVDAKCGAFEGDAGEESASARVGKNFSSHGDIGLCRGIAADRSSGGARIATELYFAGENALGTAVVHEQENEVGGIAAELETSAAAFKSHHCGSAPGAVECGTAATGHQAATIAATEADGELEDGG